MYEKGFPYILSCLAIGIIFRCSSFCMNSTRNLKEVDTKEIYREIEGYWLRTGSKERERVVEN